jgi:hypothetical protein
MSSDARPQFQKNHLRIDVLDTDKHMADGASMVG